MRPIMSTSVFYALRVPNSHDGEPGEPCVSADAYDALSELLKLSQADANSLAADLNRHKVRVRELHEQNVKLRERLDKYEPPLSERIRRIHQK